MKLFKKAKKGFTLVELVVVIAVIAILAAVSVGAYFGITDAANEARLRQEAEQIHLALRIISLKGDPNQTLKRDGLYIIDDGLEMFDLQLGYELGWSELNVVDEQPQHTSKKLVYLCDPVTGSNGEVLFTHFNYYTSDIMNKTIKVSIIGNAEYTIEAASLSLPMHECGLHSLDTPGDHYLLDCGHYACQKDMNHDPAPCGVAGHYNCDGKGEEHTQASSCPFHQYECQCDDEIIVPEGSTLELIGWKESFSMGEFYYTREVLKTLTDGETIDCNSIGSDWTLELSTKYYFYSLPSNQRHEGWKVSLTDLGKNTTTIDENMNDIIFGIPVVNVSYLFQRNEKVEYVKNISKNAINWYVTFSSSNVKAVHEFHLNKNVSVLDTTFSGTKQLVYGPILKEIDRWASTRSSFNLLQTFKESNIELENFRIWTGTSDMRSLFSGCKGISGEVSIPDSVINMSYAFEGTNITKATFEKNENNSEKIVDLSSSFKDCVNLVETDLTGIKKSSGRLSNNTTEESMSYTFKNCKKLERFGKLPFAKNYIETFAGCESIKQEEIHIPNEGNVNPSVVRNIFKDAKNLNGTIIFDYIKKSDVSGLFTGATVKNNLTIKFNNNEINNFSSYNLTKLGQSFGADIDKVKFIFSDEITYKFDINSNQYVEL